MSTTGIRGKWTWCPEKNCLIDYVEPPKKEVNAPYVITDEIPGGIRSMADRQTYTSKAKLRAAYRRQGFVEVGNEEIKEEKYEPWKDDRYMEQLEADVEKAYYQCRDGTAEISELDRERFKIVDKQIEEGHDNRDRDWLGRVRG